VGDVMKEVAGYKLQACPAGACGSGVASYKIQVTGY